MDVNSIIIKFDQFLKQNQKTFEAVVIGGAALNIMNVITRQTRDIDLIDPQIPEDIKELSKEFALKNDLDLDWLNNGPISIIKNLPENWNLTLVEIYSGESLILKTLNRDNLLKTKLFAYCDRQMDENDCIALRPTEVELEDSISWIKLQDANPDWPNHVKEMIDALKEKI